MNLSHFLFPKTPHNQFSWCFWAVNVSSLQTHIGCFILFIKICFSPNGSNSGTGWFKVTLTFGKVLISPWPTCNAFIKYNVRLILCIALYKLMAGTERREEEKDISSLNLLWLSFMLFPRDEQQWTMTFYASAKFTAFMASALQDMLLFKPCFPRVKAKFPFHMSSDSSDACRRVCVFFFQPEVPWSPSLSSCEIHSEMKGVKAFDFRELHFPCCTCRQPLLWVGNKCVTERSLQYSWRLLFQASHFIK